jgi:phage terminase small subunit
MAKPKGARQLEIKKQKLVDAYILNGGNKKAAAIEAGYNVNYRQNAYQLFADPMVKEMLAERKQLVREKFEAKLENILNELGEIVYGYKRLAKYKKVDSKGNLYWDFTGATEEDLAFITTLDTEVKFEGDEDGEGVVEVRKIKVGGATIADAKAALDSLAKLIGLDKNRIELSGPDGKPVEIDNKELGRKIAFILKRAIQEETT